jgi:hypothetical protein
MVSLTYRITPALRGATNRRDIYGTVRLDPPADPEFWDDVLVPGAERDATPGAASTEAAVGPFVLPDSTARVTIHLVEAAVTTGNRRASFGGDRDLGEIIVDLSARTARWQPAGH